MSGYLVSDWGIDTDKWTEMKATIEKQRKGKIALSLGKYADTDKPWIEAGSYIEVAGALYGFNSAESIPGDGTDTSINYIMVNPITITAEWTVTPPTWSASKNGWYDAGEAKRYIGGCYRNGASYSDKWVYHESRSIKGLTGGLADLVLGKSGVHIGSNTRSTDGDQVITGVGFKPSVIIFLAVDSTGINKNWSVGFNNKSIAACIKCCWISTV